MSNNLFFTHSFPSIEIRTKDKMKKMNKTTLNHIELHYTDIRLFNPSGARIFFHIRFDFVSLLLLLLFFSLSQKRTLGKKRRSSRTEKKEEEHVVLP